MSPSPLQVGDFVWCAFPKNEAPLSPGPLHVAYALTLSSLRQGYGVMIAYTTSQPWDKTLPSGVITFDVDAAKRLGQTRAFVLDLRRIAFLPIDEVWFPLSGQPGAGVLGHAPKALRDRLNTIVTDLVRRRSEIITRTGPLWR